MYLLTGGSGFIGGHFHRLIPNEELINFDLVPPQFNHSANFILGDIRIKSNILGSIKTFNVDCIISLAAKHHDFGIGHDEYFDTNEDGTRVICEAAGENGIKKIIFYSSVAVYGIREEISTENLLPEPNGPYGASKLAGEKVLIKWASEDPTRSVVIIRPTLVYGPNNRANMFNLIKQIDSGFYFHLGQGDNIKSIAYVENLVRATLFLKERMKPGVVIYNYADEPQLSSRAIATTIANELNKKIRLTIPSKLGVALGWPFDLVIKLTKKNLPISSARIKKLSTQTYHSGSKIFNEGFKPEYSTTEGIKEMVKWYKSIMA